MSTFLGTIKLTIDDEGNAVAVTSIPNGMSEQVTEIIERNAHVIVNELNDLTG